MSDKQTFWEKLVERFRAWRERRRLRRLGRLWYRTIIRDVVRVYICERRSIYGPDYIEFKRGNMRGSFHKNDLISEVFDRFSNLSFEERLRLALKLNREKFEVFLYRRTPDEELFPARRSS